MQTPTVHALAAADPAGVAAVVAAVVAAGGAVGVAAGGVVAFEPEHAASKITAALAIAAKRRFTITSAPPTGHA